MTRNHDALSAWATDKYLHRPSLSPENSKIMSKENIRVLRAFDANGKETDFKIPAVFLLASEVWEPLAGEDCGFMSNDSVIPLPGEDPADVAVLVKWLIRDPAFQITADNFFILARLADKYIVPHLTSTLSYFSHTLIATTKPNYELWLAAARHEMPLVENYCRNAARMEVANMLAQKGISYFIVDQGIRPGAMDGIIMDLLRVKDNYVAYRQVNGSLRAI